MRVIIRLARGAALAAAMLMTATFSAQAANLSDAEIKRFIASLPGIEKLAEDMENSGVAAKIEMQTEPKPGEDFRPYSQAVNVLQSEHMAAYRKLEGAVKPHGFSPAVWGKTGDRVMAAYLAEKMAREAPGGAQSLAQMPQMDPQMLEMMPPEMRQRLEAAKSMMTFINNVPESDRAAIRPHVADLDAHFDAAGQPKS